MTSSTRLPMVWPTRPRSQPGMTCEGVAPTVKPSGAPLRQDESKSFLLAQITPTYCTRMGWPFPALGPVPLIRVRTASVVGGAALGIVTDGAEPCAFPTAGRVPPPVETCCPPADAVAAYDLIRSTTNTRVSVALTPPCGLPWAPYPSAGGITARTRLPARWPARACF